MAEGLLLRFHRLQPKKGFDEKGRAFFKRAALFLLSVNDEIDILESACPV
jgi:hypothetical protein